ncbi:MAG: DUF86 domain-containing protein [Armatimonadetes bacterium]|nr:DUF86 domain-containing protein [Armatimonadota bacterium]
MQPDDRNVAHLWDMREAAIELLAQGVTYHRFVTEKMLRRSVERQIEIIGEAARRASTEFKEAHPEIPWPHIIAQRNVLAHEYGEILVERIWSVATERLPELVHLLDPLIPTPPEEK